MANTQNTMKELSVAQIIKEHNLIVPEIQREYVWGFNSRGIINTFFDDVKQAFNAISTDKDEIYTQLEALRTVAATSDSATKTALAPRIKELETKTLGQILNLGFLYSHKPNYDLDANSKDVFLIDGQQRFTTIFLLLFFFAIKEDRKKEFLEIFCQDLDQEKIAFDYRVRNITHDFVIDLISNVEKVEDFKNLRKKNWFLANYKNDTTVKAIVGVAKNEGLYALALNAFENDDNKYFDFFLNKIKFWHFKTQETSQGEELYITMNSRGQQLEDNETIRAKLFESDEARNNNIYWSEQWELWQDFFWKNRNKKSHNSADPGFNELLRWVVLLNLIEERERKGKSFSDEKRSLLVKLLRGNYRELPVSYLSLMAIEKIFNAFKTLFEMSKNANSTLLDSYPKISAISYFKADELNVLDIPLKQIELFKLLPCIQFVMRQKEIGEDISSINVFRFLRFFHNRARSNNIQKSIDTSIYSAISLVNSIDVSGDISSVLNASKEPSKTVVDAEERLKLSRFSNTTERLSLEQVYWIAEDHHLNEGSISHLMDLSTQISKETGSKDDVALFYSVYQKYVKVLNAEHTIWGDLLTTEMYTKDLDRVYFESNWHRNTSILSLTKECFLNSEKTLIDILLNRRKKFVRSYGSIEELKSEINYKNQLYLNYIITKNIANEKWIWDDKWNLGAYSSTDVPSSSSLFDTGYIYQRFNAQWRYNVGYQKHQGLWIQDYRDKNRDYFKELLEWVNKN